MKKVFLAQNLARLVIALLVLAMLFLPWFSMEVQSISKERMAQLTAMGLIAVDRGDMTEEEFEDMMELIAPIALENGKIQAGFDADDDELPFDYDIDLLYPGKDYLVDSKHPENLSDLSYVAQSEIGDDDDKKEISVSIFSAIKGIVKGGGFTLRLITTNILEESELEKLDESASESQIAETVEKVAKNREECGFSDALIMQLSAIGVENSDTWVYLSKLDTSDLSEEVMDLVWFTCSLTSFTGILVLLFVIIVAITLLLLALGEIISLIKGKFVAPGAEAGCKLFQYASSIGIIAAVTYLITGAEISPLFTVILALILASAIAYSFTPGKAKQRKGNAVFFWGVRAVSVICLVICIVAGSMGLGINAFETIINEDSYEETCEKVLERNEDEYNRLTQEMERLVISASAENNYNVEAIKTTEQNLEILNAKMQYDAANQLTIFMQLFKLWVFFYLLLLAGYLGFAIDRLGAIKSMAFPSAAADVKIAGNIFKAVLAAVVETLWLGEIVTPFAYIFGVIAVVEILFAIFKKISRKFEYNYVVGKGKSLCTAGELEAEDWNNTFEKLDAMEEKVSSLKTLGVVDTLDVLLGEYDAKEITSDELGRKMQETFLADINVKKEIPSKKKRR